MLYQLSHFIQSKAPWLWSVLERGNGQLFLLRYGRRLRGCLPKILTNYPSVKVVDQGDSSALEAFFATQPESAFQYFRPHGFDVRTIEELVKNPSLLMFIVEQNQEIVGYFFLRSFFIGKAFLGKMVDYGCQGQGVGKMMCQCAMDISSSLGLRMFETISKDNLASLYSSQKVLEVKVLEEMENGYLFIEDVRKKSIL